MGVQTLQIRGMTCDHCARTVEDTLNTLPGVRAQVSYEQGIAEVVAPDDVGIERLLKAVEAKGFKASLIE